jgi:hypothetical protein
MAISSWGACGATSCTTVFSITDANLRQRLLDTSPWTKTTRNATLLLSLNEVLRCFSCRHRSSRALTRRHCSSRALTCCLLDAVLRHGRLSCRLLVACSSRQRRPYPNFVEPQWGPNCFSFFKDLIAFSFLFKDLCVEKNQDMLPRNILVQLISIKLGYQTH